MKEAFSPYVLGIDLGTTNSSASVYLKGEPRTIPLSPTVANKGNKSIPSVVRFEGGKRDQLSVGMPAKRHILISPHEIFSSVKTVMRRDDWKEDSALIEKYKLGDSTIEPHEIAAEILKQLIEEVHSQDSINMKGAVARAVICVPANTTDVYRTRVFKAAVLAGLGERDENDEIILDEQERPVGVRLLDEPTAAAIEYGRQLGFWSDEREQTILVYDLGGGTFDVTILRVDSTSAPPKFTVLATNGIAQLGGDDFDRALMEMCAEEFKFETEIDIFDLKAENKGTSGKVLKEAQQRLKEAAEEAKINFAGGANRETINLPTFVVVGDTKEAIDLEIEIKRSDYLDRIQPLLDETKRCVQDALAEAGLTTDDINRVVMVGGSTKADWVRESIRDTIKEPYVASDVDVIVSQGAAVYGASLLTQYDDVDAEDISDSEVESTVGHHLGVELQGGKFGLVMPKTLTLNEEHPEQEIKHTFGNPDMTDRVRITVWKTQKLIDDVELVNDEYNTNAELYVSERDERDNRVYECIGEMILKGIPKAKRGSLPILVTMKIDEAKTLHVKAECSGKEIDASFSTTA